MKTYLTYKNQIEGFKDVLETIKTVEKIAASSVHFLRQEVSKLNIYTTEIEKVMNRLLLFYPQEDKAFLESNSKLLTPNEPRKKGVREKALVVLTGDRGLVGGLWHKVVNAVLKTAEQYQSIIVVGKKGRDYLKEENIAISPYPSVGESEEQRNPSDITQKERTKAVVDYIFDEFRKGAFSSIDILYPQFVSLAEQRPLLIPFLPFEFTQRLFEQNQNAFPEKKSAREGLPIFEPSKRKVLDWLLQKYIKVFFHKVAMEAKLSELSARTVAMEHAGAKTKDLIQELTLDYLKERRRIITQKQTESFMVHKIPRSK